MKLVFFSIIIFNFLYFNKSGWNKKSIKNTTPFFLILFFYLSFRYTGAFGFGSIYNHHTIYFTNIPSGALELFHNILGRYFFRNLIYGIYLFFMIELKWFILIFFKLSPNIHYL